MKMAERRKLRQEKAHDEILKAISHRTAEQDEAYIARYRKSDSEAKMVWQRALEKNPNLIADMDKALERARLRMSEQRHTLQKLPTSAVTSLLGWFRGVLRGLRFSNVPH